MAASLLDCWAHPPSLLRLVLYRLVRLCLQAVPRRHHWHSQQRQGEAPKARHTQTDKAEQEGEGEEEGKAGGSKEVLLRDIESCFADFWRLRDGYREEEEEALLLRPTEEGDGHDSGSPPPQRRLQGGAAGSGRRARPIVPMY